MTTRRPVQQREYDELLAEADWCCTQLGHRHGRVRHCAEGLVKAEKVLRWDERFPWLRTCDIDGPTDG